MKRKGNTFEYAKCPKCKTKEVWGNDQVIKLFGTRNNHGYFMVQSWCKECR